jgi:hypothetical protein
LLKYFIRFGAEALTLKFMAAGFANLIFTGAAARCTRGLLAAFGAFGASV